ncbi:MAG TPA: hypothetical protein EYP14_04630 [Planctomycetaceae bacterium]|nr:hypothetical protein [Planctomycetaceae bacterium]
MVVLSLAGIGLQLSACKTPKAPAASSGRRKPSDVSDAVSPWPHLVSVWLLAAWWGGLALSIPFYRAYPRLTLPWLLVAWLGIAAAVGFAARWLPVTLASPSPGGTPRPRWRWAGLLTALLAASVAGLMGRAADLNGKGVPGWRDRTGLERIAHRVIQTARAHRRRPVAPPDGGTTIEFIFYVYAEPALFFHLSVADVVAQPVTNLDFASPAAPRSPVPVYLVAGPHALRSETFRRQLEDYRDHFVLLNEFAYRPSPLVLLNDYDPRTLDGAKQEKVRLYAMRP